MGLYASHRLHRRAWFLATCDRLLKTLWQRMAYTASPLTELWRGLADSGSFSGFSLVTDVAQTLDSRSFASAFSTAVEKAADVGLLLPSTRQVLLEFAEGCGSTDLAGQQAHIEYYRTLVQQLWEQADDLWREQGRVYRVLGPAAGVALALLLL